MHPNFMKGVTFGVFFLLELDITEYKGNVTSHLLPINIGKMFLCEVYKRLSETCGFLV